MERNAATHDPIVIVDVDKLRQLNSSSGVSASVLPWVQRTNLTGRSPFFCLTSMLAKRSFPLVNKEIPVTVTSKLISLRIEEITFLHTLLYT